MTSTSILGRSGTRSRRAAVLISLVLRVSGIGSGLGISISELDGVADESAGDAGGMLGMVSSGIFMDSSGAMGSGAGGAISIFGSGNGPTGSASSPVSPSGIEDGAATGSEKTGSSLVVLVISSIAFCRSLSTVV